MIKELEKRNLTVKDFKELVEKSNNKKAKMLLPYMLSDNCPEEQLEGLVKSFFEIEEKEANKPLYKLKLNDKTIAEFKGDKKEAEELFNSTAETLSNGRDWEIKEKGDFYFLSIDKSIEEKLQDGDHLTESEIESLCWDYPEVYEEEHDSGRWTTFMTTVVDVNGKNYAINWQRGLTEYQENIYDEQPYECELVEEEVTITKTTIYEIKKDKWKTLTIDCNQCGKSFEVKVKENDWKVYESGKGYIQDIFPYLTPEERELIKTKVCGKCFDMLIQDED